MSAAPLDDGFITRSLPDSEGFSPTVTGGSGGDESEVDQDTLATDLHIDCLHIDCGVCELKNSPSCSDCVVNYLLDDELQKHDCVVISMSDQRAIRELQGAGLVPQLRYAPRLNNYNC